MLGGVLGFYYFDGISNLFRVSGFILVVGLAIGLFWTTSRKKTAAFERSSGRGEESCMADATGNFANDFFVLVVVVIFAILLWLLDLLLSSIVNALI